MTVQVKIWDLYDHTRETTITVPDGAPTVVITDAVRALFTPDDASADWAIVDPEGAGAPG